MLLKRWEPLADLRRMDAEMDRMWRHMVRPSFVWRRLRVEDGHVAMDMFQDGDNLVVRAAVPGVGPEDLEVTVTGEVLTVNGAANSEKEVKEEDYLHRERRLGSFRRRVALPQV